MLFEQILSLIPCAVFWKDNTGAFKGCNKHFLTFANLKDKKDLLEKTDKELPWANRWEEYWKDDQFVITTRQTISREEKVTTPTKEIIAHTTKTPWIQDGEVVGVLGVIYDVTELVSAKEKAELANRVKTDFIHNMQHDLRTPAYGVSSALADLLKAEADEEKRKKLSLVYRSAKQLYRLCFEVTEFDKIEHKEKVVTNKKFDLKKLVSSVIDLNKTAAYKKGLQLLLTIEDNVPSVVKSDSYRIKRILINLIGNAIKFTKSGTVSLKVCCLKKTGNNLILRFEVKDTGIGIPQDKIEFIYEKFTRGTPANQSIYKGIGLGLHLVKNFVEDLTGDIEVKSSAQEGSIFHITLPCAIPLSDDLMEDSDSQDGYIFEDEDYTPLDLGPLEINSKTTSLQETEFLTLLIEDEPLASMAEKNVLETMSCTVHVVGSVAAAKAELAKRKYHFIVSDIGLPDGDGFQILESIREDKKGINFHTPIFALTAHGGKDKIREAEEAGFASLLTKPLVAKKFKLLLQEYVIT